MSFDRSKWVWMNGECVRWDDARIHVSAHGLHYGTGVFEGMRCYKTGDGPAIFRLDAHIARLFESAGAHAIDLQYSPAELEDASCEIVGRNGFESCYVRPICHYGSGALGLNPRGCPVEVAILAWPWEALLGSESIATGVRVTVSRWLKFNSQMLPTTAKACGQYLNSILATREALSRGYDEALLLDSDGYLAEGSGENVFVVRGGKLFTNDENSSILLGITRDSVIKIACDLGYEVEVGMLTVDDLLAADEVFLTGTAAEVTPVRELDGSPIADGRRGPITHRIQEAFYSITSGVDRRYNQWLRLVSGAGGRPRPEPQTSTLRAG